VSTSQPPESLPHLGPRQAQTGVPPMLRRPQRRALSDQCGAGFIGGPQRCDGQTRQQMLDSLSFSGSALEAVNTANAQLIKVIGTCRRSLVWHALGY